jgi:hypothetical protein
MTTDDPMDRTGWEPPRLDGAFVDGAVVREPSAEERWEAARAEVQRLDEERSAASRARRRRRMRSVVAVCCVFALVAAVGPRLELSDAEAGRRLWLPRSEQVVGRTGDAGRPTPQTATSDQPLVAAPSAPTAGGDHAFLVTQPGSGDPAAWDRCRPIPVVVNRFGQPPGAEGLFEDALQQMGSAAGVRFDVEGTTDEAPAFDRPPTAERYGDRWAPVLLAWSHAGEVAELDGPVAGLGGPTAVNEVGSDRLHLVTGLVILDAPDFGEILSGEDGRAVALGIVLHELAHLLGLGHVDDPSQLMYGQASEVTELGAGDLEGLARLAEQPCAGAL